MNTMKWLPVLFTIFKGTITYSVIYLIVKYIMKYKGIAGLLKIILQGILLTAIVYLIQF